MRYALLGYLCGLLIGFGGGYLVFGHEKTTTCSTQDTGRIDVSTMQPKRETVCVQR